MAIARAVLEQGAADELWFLVSPQNPLKMDYELLPEADRQRMVELAIENESGMKASDFEFTLPRPSYTINTLEKLKTDFPQHQFSLLIGGDNLLIINKWIEYKRIIAEFGLIVYPRPGFKHPTDQRYPNTIFIQAPLIDISATEIRDKIKKGESIKSMVPVKVAMFLKEAKGR